MKTTKHFSRRRTSSPKASATAKAKQAMLKAKAKAEQIKAKAIVREAKHRANLKRGGVRGAFARAVEHKLVKAEAKNRLEALKPDLYKKGQQTMIETDAANKRTKARGAAMATVASALGASYASGKEADARKEAYKTAGIEAQTKAITTALDGVPDVDQIKPDNKSVAGLVTGVR